MKQNYIWWCGSSSGASGSVKFPIVANIPSSTRMQSGSIYEGRIDGSK